MNDKIANDQTYAKKLQSVTKSIDIIFDDKDSYYFKVENEAESTFIVPHTEFWRQQAFHIKCCKEQKRGKGRQFAEIPQGHNCWEACLWSGKILKMF